MDSVGTLLTVLTSLVAVPLTASLFYVRSLRESQLVWQADLLRRIETLESELRRSVVDFAHDYATKEEWLRECMMTRRQLERLMSDSNHPERPFGCDATRAGLATRSDGAGTADPAGFEEETRNVPKS